MPHALDSLVPLLFGLGLLAVLLSAALSLGALPTASSILALIGTATLFTAAAVECRADSASRRAPPEHATEPHNPHDDFDASPALDAPATSLVFCAATLWFLSAALAAAAENGARLWPPLAPLLLLIGAAAVLAASALSLAAELQRGADVALIARAVRSGGGGGGGGGGDGSWRVVCAAAAAYEATLRPSPLRRAASLCGGLPVPLAELRRGMSPIIFSALALNLGAALCLTVSAALLLGGGRLASGGFVVQIAAFSLFLMVRLDSKPPFHAICRNQSRALPLLTPLCASAATPSPPPSTGRWMCAGGGREKSGGTSEGRARALGVRRAAGAGGLGVTRAAAMRGRKQLADNQQCVWG